jgi:hypothetical protein
LPRRPSACRVCPSAVALVDDLAEAVQTNIAPEDRHPYTFPGDCRTRQRLSNRVSYVVSDWIASFPVETHRKSKEGHYHMDDRRMSATAELRALRLFLEKAEKLWGFSYSQDIVNEPSGFTLNYDRDTGITTTRRGPVGEPIDAYVLTLRFFIQDNEPTSIRNMTKHVDSLFAKGLIRDEQRASWGEARDALNTFLDSETFLKVNGETLTNRRILEVVVFGGYAHANESKKKEFDSWQRIDSLFQMAMNEFINITGRFNYWLHDVRRLVGEMVVEAESRRSGES